jgi:hypothetical protein
VKTLLRTDLTVADICNGFVYNQLEGKGLFGLGGKLTIQPEYQRTTFTPKGAGKGSRRSFNRCSRSTRSG